MDLPIKAASPSEVKKEIMNLNNSKSPGYNLINAKVAKLLPKKAIVFLTIMYNSMFRLSHFPDQWKCAKIVMVPKLNKPEFELTSYRSISLLVTFSKIFERIFLRRMQPILASQNIIPEHQFGFRCGHGTPEQCHRVVDKITQALENKEYCSAVFLDIEKAFDRVWHECLLYKIKTKLPTPYFLLLKSYIENRTFYIQVQNYTSNLYKIQAGVPQGSVIGPILYTIYTSDMPIAPNIFTATYADDTAILVSNKNKTTASTEIQKQLQKIEQWLSSWNIKVNASKSIHTTFTTRKGNCPSLILNGGQIPQKDTVNYLGMHLDRRLTWKAHVKAKTQQLKTKNKRLYWLIGPRSQLSLENKLRIYKIILKPIWTYGIQLWGAACNSTIEIMQRYQSKTLRLIANAPWYISNESIHKDLEIPYIKAEIKAISERYLSRLSYHNNILAISLLDDSMETKRLKRYHTLDLPYRR